MHQLINNMNYERPIYDITIDEALHLGVDEVAFVHDPAIEELFIAMAKEEIIKLAMNDDKMIVTGPVLIPEKLIFRIHPKTGEEYYIRFSAEVIQQIVLRYFTQNKQINFNLEHNKENSVQGVIMESWLVEHPEHDKSAAMGFKMPVGTWMASVKVEDKQFWDTYVKTGLVRGFSIEGSFGQELVEAMNKEKLVEPKSGETKDEYIARCIAYNINEGMAEDQAAAVCYTKWDEKLSEEELRTGDKVSFDYDKTINTRIGKQLARKEIQSGSEVYIISARGNAAGMYAIADELGIPHERVFATGSNLQKVAKIKELGIDVHYDNNRMVKKLLPKGIGINFSLSAEEAELLIKEILLESYTDYPEAAKEAAARGIRYNEENGNKCATQTGKIRAQQIANGEPLSYDTLKRTYSYLSRAKEYYNENDKEACGTISYLLWGGEPMFNWVERKLKEIENQ